MKKHTSNWFKGNSFIIALLSGSVLLLLLFVFVATLSGTWPSSEISAQIMAALAGAVVTAIITMFLLLGQTSSEEKKERHAKIFEEKLQIYNDFLQKLCEVVSNMEISRQEEIELEFQVARIAMHTSAESINRVSEQVSKIIAGIKTKENQNGEMLTELFAIADTFYKELYGQANEQDNTRIPTIDNFRMILRTEAEIKQYRQMLHHSESNALSERIEQLRILISEPKSVGRVYMQDGMMAYAFTTKSIPVEGSANMDEEIIAQLLPDDKAQTYRLTILRNVMDLFEYDTKALGEELRKIGREIWPEMTLKLDMRGKTPCLLYKEIPFSEPNEVIAKEMEILLTNLKNYCDKHYGIQ